ncbi:MAG: DUF5777 family beta-barrel protein [Blastocatellia bacterium]
MSLKAATKLFLVLSVTVFITTLMSSRATAFPDYLKRYAADPMSKPEMRTQCAVCHVSPAGGGERNAFGKAFETSGYRFTDNLKSRFPQYFNTSGGAQAGAPPVEFVAGSDSQAIVEINGKKYLIDTKTRAVTEYAATATRTTERPREETPAPTPAATSESENVYQPMDFRLISMPTAKTVKKKEMWTDFTHRFPFGEYEVTDFGGLLGLDGFAVPSFGFIYGVTDRVQVGFYRSPHILGAPIQLSAGVNLADENKGHPLTATARIGVEGRGNFRRNFTTSVELAVARSVTSKAQLYVTPTISFNNRPFGPSSQKLPGETTFALGVGGALNVRPTVAIMAEANMRVNREGRFDSTRPAFGFGVEKVSVSKKHAFALVFSNGVGTTMSQRSATRGSILGPGSEESFKGMTIGFNLTRRLF